MIAAHLLSYIFNLVIFLSQILFLKSFSSSQNRCLKRLFLSLFILFIYFQIVPYFDYSVQKDDMIWLLLFFICSLLEFFSYFTIAFFIYKNSFSDSIISVFICFFILLISQILTSGITVFLFPNMLDRSTWSLYQKLFYQFILCLLFSSSLWTISKFLKKYPIRFLNKKSSIRIFILAIQLILFPFLLIPIIGTLTKSIKLANASALLISILIILFFVDVIFCFITLRSIQKAQFKMELEGLYAEFERDLNYYESLHNNIEQIRKIRHDFNNHLQLAYILLKQYSTDKPSNPELLTEQSFLNQVAISDSDITSVHFSDNIILNFYLQTAYTQSQNRNIPFIINVDIPKDIPMDNLDLCSLFSNLLSNALQATEKTHNPLIRLNASYSNGELDVMIYNTSPKHNNEYRDPKIHGYGLLILNDLAHKYHGSFQTEQTDDTFTAYFHASLEH